MPHASREFNPRRQSACQLALRADLVVNGDTPCASFRGAKQTNAPWGVTANERAERIFHVPNHHGPVFGLAPSYLLAQRARFP